MSEATSRLKIQSMDEFQGGATILPDRSLGYVLYFSDNKGNLGDPIYVSDETYSEICTAIAVNKSVTNLMLLGADIDLPQKGYYGVIFQEK